MCAYKKESLPQVFAAILKKLSAQCANKVDYGTSHKKKNKFQRNAILTHFILETPKRVLAKNACPDQMPHNMASDPGLHYFASSSTIFQ